MPRTWSVQKARWLSAADLVRAAKARALGRPGRDATPSGEPARLATAVTARGQREKNKLPSAVFVAEEICNGKAAQWE